MKRDIAERLAAAGDDRLPVSAVRPTVDAFVRYLSICTACDGDGTLTLRVETKINVHDADQSFWHWAGPAGTVIDCLACGGSGQDRASVGWHCIHEDTRKHCEDYKTKFTGRVAEQHQPCGYRLMLPIPGREQVSGTPPAVPVASEPEVPLNLEPFVSDVPSEQTGPQ